ncbi:Pentatricopeptide repeat-containing protein [Symbiodinium microadriaticum]|uniref:Pentatricopeptide repeat-containing protein n=1 Tax=Symbiodinium microadriaticum TaxID=2951 RepID=A0A1Q9DVU1_SYMMI|nr:Pentatricopeptide repeat-containing protein [Symbiodinium microadriaticum]
MCLAGDVSGGMGVCVISPARACSKTLEQSRQRHVLRLVSQPGRPLREAPQRGIVAKRLRPQQDLEGISNDLGSDRGSRKMLFNELEEEEQKDFETPSKQVLDKFTLDSRVPDDMMERLSSIDLSLEDEDEASQSLRLDQAVTGVKSSHDEYRCPISLALPLTVFVIIDRLLKDMELDADDEDMEACVAWKLVERSQLEELEEEPADEAALMKAVEVSDDEVSEFLAEFNAQPVVAKVPIDPFEKDASKELDTFKELKNGKRDLFYARGMPSNQMVITLKDRLNMLSEHAAKTNLEGFPSFMIFLPTMASGDRHLEKTAFAAASGSEAHVNANRPMAAESWVKDMLNRVFQPDIYSYNTLLKCYGRRGDFLKVVLAGQKICFTEAEKWIRRMRARGYSALVQAPWSYLAGLRAQERVFGEMEVTDASNTFAHNTLLKAYAQKEQAKKAEKLFETMAKPDATTYLQMIRVAASVSDPQGAADWLRRMSEVMTAHAKMGDMEGAEAWFRVMLDEGMRPELVRMEDLQLRPAPWLSITDVVTYSTLLSAFAKATLMGNTGFEAGNAIGARDWLLQAEAGIEPDLNCYKQIIKAGLAIWLRLQGGSKADGGQLRAGEACVQSGDAAMAERMARRLLRNRLTPDALSAEMDVDVGFREFLPGMKDLAVLDVYTYNMLLNALAKAGNWASAEFWVDHMQRAARWKHHEFPLDQISVAYAEAGDLEGAEAWMMQMVGEGIEPQEIWEAPQPRELVLAQDQLKACWEWNESAPLHFRPLAFTEEEKHPANTVVPSQHQRSGYTALVTCKVLGLGHSAFLHTGTLSPSTLRLRWHSMPPRSSLKKLFEQRRVATESRRGAVSQSGTKRKCPEPAAPIQSLLLDGIDIHSEWKMLLQEEFAQRQQRDIRACVSALRQLGQRTTDAHRLLHQLRTAPTSSSPAAKAIIDEFLACRATSEGASEEVRTVVDRFDHISNEISCPHGCEGPTRYGYRVGDLNKYAIMERHDQLTAVLSYCPKCHFIFDGNL